MRVPIDTGFEASEHSVEAWRAMIEAETQHMDVIHDGIVDDQLQLDSLLPPLGADPHMGLMQSHVPCMHAADHVAGMFDEDAMQADGVSFPGSQ